MKKLFSALILGIFGLVFLFSSAKTVYADAISDCLQANPGNTSVCLTSCQQTNQQVYCNCRVNLNGTDSECTSAQNTYNDCLKNNTPTECAAGAGLYNNSGIWFIQTPLSAAQQMDYATRHPEQVSNFSFNFNLLTTTAAQAAFMAVGTPSVNSNGQLQTSGAAQFFAGGIDFMDSHRPASSIDYLAYMGSRLRVPGTPTPAYAANGGYGFNALQPILPVWTVMRNLAYFMFALVFIIVGVMIMFRVKIDPKTAANIQNSLPKIIVALLLVTFSYAIAGFMIDLMWVLISLIFGVFASVNAQAAALVGIEQNLTATGHSIFSVFLIPGGQITGLATGATAKITASLLGFQWTDFLTKGPEALGKFITVGGITVLAFLIIGLAILWALFKTWLSLLSAYAQIVLAIIFAPLLLMLEAVPGRSTFGFWLKTLLTNLLVFPLVIVMMLVALFLANSGVTTIQSGTSTGFVPPLIGGNDLGGIQALIGVGILLTIPKAIDILQEVLKTPPFKYGTAFMEPLQWAAVKGPARGAVNTGVYNAWQRTRIGSEAMYAERYPEVYAKVRAEQSESAANALEKPKAGWFTRAIGAGVNTITNRGRS